jgi:hypothetical protein
MALEAAKVGLAVQQGLNVVCATCEHYWNALDRGARTCGKSCGGLAVGKSFPAYKGPIRDMTRQCFVCGETTVHVAKHPKRNFGVCARHEGMVAKWCGEFGIAFETVKRIYKKKTLGQAIFEVENYFAQKEGREL